MSGAPASHKKLAPSCPQRCSSMLPSPRRVRARFAQAWLISNRPQTKGQRPAARSTAAQCVIAALSAMHVQEERDSHWVCQPQTRSQRLLSSARQPNAAIAASRAMHVPTRARPTSSAAASHAKPAPCCPQHCRPMLLLPSATHAQHKRDSHGVHQPRNRSGCPAVLGTAAPYCCCRVPCTLARVSRTSSAPASHEKTEPSCSQLCSPMMLSPRQVRCQPGTSVTRIKCTSLRREARAQRPQRCCHPRAECHERST